MNLALIRQIDEQLLETRFLGVRQTIWHLKNEDHQVNEKRIRRLMRLNGPDADLPEVQHGQAGERAQDLAWRITPIPEADFCVDVSNEAAPNSARQRS